MGFVFSVMPLEKSRAWKNREWADFLQRHVQLFNTHPYLSAPILGSVTKAEEELTEGRDGASIVQLKKALMGPYAAIGDTFFWGTWRSFAGIAAVILALMDFSWSPVVFLLLYNPPHLWIRGKGFLEGYRRGNGGLQFVQMLNLPVMNPRIRWLSLGGLALLAAWWLETVNPLPTGGVPGIVACLMALSMILLCNWAVGKRISPVMQFYAMAVVFFLISI